MGIIRDDVTRQRASYIYRWWFNQEQTVVTPAIDILGYDATYFVFCTFVHSGGRIEYQIQHSDTEGGPYEDVGPENLVFGRYDGNLPIVSSPAWPYAREGVRDTKRWLRVIMTTVNEPLSILAVTYAVHDVLALPASQDAPLLG